MHTSRRPFLSMLTLPEDFESKLESTYENAMALGNLVFNGDNAVIEFVTEDIKGSTYNSCLTLLDSLVHRPEKGTVDKNPFVKLEPELTVLDSYGEQDEFKLVLNKFPVVPYHFMLLTKEFKSQNTPLSPNEICAVFEVLKALEHAKKENKDWFAFYNCGPQSGASQPHKHVQFMSFPDGFEPFVSRLARTSPHFVPNQRDEPLQDPKLGFAHFVAVLPEKLAEVDNDLLMLTFVGLLQRVLTVLREADCDHVSYNFCATTKWMMLMPRSTGSYEEKLGVNSCGVMGLYLCKNKELFDLVKEAGWEKIQISVGFPSTTGQGTDEYHY